MNIKNVINQDIGNDDDFAIEKNNIYKMDCIDGMNLMDSDSVDLIVTDPPYYIANLKENLKEQTLRQLSKNNIFFNEFDHFESLDDYKKFMFDCLHQFNRILKPMGQVYMFVSYHHLDWMISYLKENFKYYKMLIWYKSNTMGVFPNQYGCNYEVILWFRTLKKKNGHFINNIGCNQRDVFSFKSTNNAYRKEAGYHPTPKPIQLIRQLVKNGSNEGCLVFDAFMGSGTTAVACKQTGRDYIGFEINEDYIKICEKRLKQDTLMELMQYEQ